MVGILNGFVAIFFPASVTIIRNAPLRIVQFLEHHLQFDFASAQLSEN